MEVSIILHDIRSSENVGSIFRTADASGAKKIYLTGYTPAPLDRFGRKNAKVAKAALGAEDSVLWERSADIHALIRELKSAGVQVVAVEQDASAVPYMVQTLGQSVAFIFGNEVEGLSRNVLNASDITIEIPMTGKKESLNVAVAAGIILYRFLVQ